MGDTSLHPAAPQRPTARGEAAAQPNAHRGFLVTARGDARAGHPAVHGINNYTLYAGLRGSEVKVDPKLAVNDLTMLGGGDASEHPLGRRLHGAGAISLRARR